jgi:protein gp37
MSINADIQWCDSTANPTMGCCGCELRSAEISACYAGNQHDRKAAWIAEQTAKGKATGYARTFEDLTRFPGRIAAAAKWSSLRGLARDDKPWLTGAPRMIFVSDMGDAFAPHKSIYIEGKYRPVEPNTDFLYLCSEIIRNVSSPDGQRHAWLWLTKQVHRAVEFERWLRAIGMPWPTNLWLGTSVTEPKYLHRVDQLMEIGDDTMTRFLSIEPLVAQVSLGGRLGTGRIGWVIVGGESGARLGRLPVTGWQARHVARPFDLEWARSIARECHEANVPYFLKQLGTNVIDSGKPIRLRDSHGGDWHEWPRDLAVREVPGVDTKWSRP